MARTAQSSTYSVWRTHVTLVGALLAVASALALPGASSAAQKGLSVDLTWATSSSEQSQTAQTVAASGARWVRMTLNWADAEPQPGQYSSWWFAQYDNAVTLAKQAGANIIFVVGTSPSWASGSTDVDTPPQNASDYANFIHYVATRYAGKVSAWEIWNEENYSRFWSTGPNAARYTALLRAAYGAVKSADVSALVLFGGLSTNDDTFVREAYAAGAKGHFDAMALHPYSCRAPNVIVTDSSGQITHDSFLGYRTVHRTMVDNGDAKPIWLTELGWSTSTQTCGVTPETQASYLTTAYQLTDQDPYVQVACWYDLRNDYWLKNENSLEAQYGLVDTEFVAKPAYAAYKSYVPGSGASSVSTESTSGSTTSTTTGAQPKRRHKTETLVSTTTSVTAPSARLSTIRHPTHTRGRRIARQRKVRAIDGVVIGADGGLVVVRMYRYDRESHRWRHAFDARMAIGAGERFRMNVTPHRHPRRMRVRVKFLGDATAAPSVSRYLTFTA